MKVVGAFLGTLVLILVVVFILSFGGNGIGLANYKFWAPKQANAERQVFENTQGYVQGKAEYINKLRREYIEATDPGQKAALKTLILDEALTVDDSKLPVDEQLFISQLKGSL